MITRYAARPVRLAAAGLSVVALGLLGGCATDSSLNPDPKAPTVGSSTAAATTDPQTRPTSTPGSPTSSALGPSTPAGPADQPVGTAADLAVLDAVSVSGAPGAEPTVSVTKTPVQVSATTRKVLTPGSGPASVAGGAIQINVVVINGTDGKQLDSTYKTSEPPVLTLSPGSTLKGLVTGLAGLRKGARVVIAVPPADGFGDQGNPNAGLSPTDHLVFVADVLDVPVVLTQAEGTPVPAVPGLPTVTFAADTGPAITVPTGTAPPSALVSQLLIDGNGPVITEGQDLTVHYTGALWKDGTVFDSSWTRGSPFQVINVGQASVITAWNKGFIGKKVGSRVLLVVPPSEGYGEAGSPPKISGTDTLVFVVDLLAAR